MKKIIFIIVGLLFLCVGGFILFMDLYFNGPNSFLNISSQIKNGVNPKWALFMFIAVLGIVGGLVMLIKGLEQVNTLKEK